MSRPIILVTPSTHAAGAEFPDHSISVSSRYLEAVLDAGGRLWLCLNSPIGVGWPSIWSEPMASC